MFFFTSSPVRLSLGIENLFQSFNNFNFKFIYQIYVIIIIYIWYGMHKGQQINVINLKNFFIDNQINYYPFRWNLSYPFVVSFVTLDLLIYPEIFQDILDL